MILQSKENICVLLDLFINVSFELYILNLKFVYFIIIMSEVDVFHVYLGIM